MTSTASATPRLTLSIDAMGGDQGPAAIVAGLAISAARHPELDAVLHGPEAELAALVARAPNLAGRVTLVNAPKSVSMHDKPSQVMRHGQDTSMWSTVEAVRDGRAQAAVSCGNTGALMAVSMLRLRKLPGVARPAIACLWPSRNAGGFNVMLDVGADVRADAPDLVQYAIMGAAYARIAFSLDRPRIGLLNVGTEETKGRPELREALDAITEAAEPGGYDPVGMVEGFDIPSDRVDVIVTDGFTGNIALKTGESTAKLIADFLREAFGSGLLSRLAGLLALNSIKRLQRRIDPRRVNGGVFLGLNGTVVKSHGAADATGVAAAIDLAFRLAQSGFLQGMAARVASATLAGQDAAGQEDGTTT